MKNETGKAFAARWRKIFGLTKFSEKSVRARLAALPLPDTRDFGLCAFLFRELPVLFPKRSGETFAKTAEAYARFCLAFWQSKNAFVPFPQDYAAFLRRALVGEIPLLDGAVCTIAEITGTPGKDGMCGFNAFAFRDAETLRAATRTARAGAYEEFLSASGLAKFREFERRLGASPEFARDWATLKALCPDYRKFGRAFVLHRDAMLERGWSRGAGTGFETAEARFRAAFNLFCWKYYLWGMDLVADAPLLLKPSVNATPYGTQIFVPAYMSYDARRDFNHAKISELHRAKGVRRQGAAFSAQRSETSELAGRARRFVDEGKARGLRGEALTDFVAEKLGRPDMERRSLRRLLRGK